MKYWTAKSIEMLARKGAAGTLAKEEWTHHAHMILAICYLYQFSFENALNKMRDSILALNKNHGVLNTDTSGYHETVTMFWMSILWNQMEDIRDLSLEEIVNVILNSEVLQSNPILEYYSSELISSKLARKTWVASDLKQFNSPIFHEEGFQ